MNAVTAHQNLSEQTTQQLYFLICGSMAYDQVMHFDGQFQDLILPNALDHLNICFVSTQTRREFGGCAGNIAYNLSCLGTQPQIIATIGQDDATAYLQHLDRLQIATHNIKQTSKAFTAQALITTDRHNNQITTFCPGAMLYANENSIAFQKEFNSNNCLAIVSPDDKVAMIQHTKQLRHQQIPYIFDPGQALPLFDANELLELMNGCMMLIVNEYEYDLLRQITNLNHESIVEHCGQLIVTRGENGSSLYSQNVKIELRPVPVANPQDPTGCGDAYRAGLMYGLMKGWSLQQAASLGSVLGAIKITAKGSQNHRINWTAIRTLYEEHYGTLAENAPQA